MTKKTKVLVEKYQRIYNTRYVHAVQHDNGKPVNQLSFSETCEKLKTYLSLDNGRMRCAALEQAIECLLDDCEEYEWYAFGQYH